MAIARGIDHLVLCVRDLERARAFYRRLGFTLTPPARHPFGTGNSLVQLQGSFLELLAVVDTGSIRPAAAGEFSFAAFNQAYLDTREGMAMLVFDSIDARADQQAFARAGLATFPPFDFERQARLPDGSEVTVGFSLAFVTDPRMPQAAFFTCQQHAPQYFWKPEYQRHANGAIGIDEVTMVARQPLDYTDFFVRLQGTECVTAADGQLTVRTTRGKLTVLDPAHYSARVGVPVSAAADGAAAFAAYTIRVTDLDPVAVGLRDGGIGFRDAGGRLRVPAEQAFGVLIEFVSD